MAEPLIAAMLLTAIVIIAIGAVTMISSPIVESSKDAVRLRDAEYTAKLIGDSIREVVEEGPNSRRTLNIRSEGGIETFPGESAIQLSIVAKAQLMDYLTRSAKGGILYIAGSDVSCSNSTNITMENTFISVTLRKVSRASPFLPINTTETVISIKEKSTGTQINLANSSIVINDNQSTSRGTGYTEILITGSGLPACTAHTFFNNTAIEYDVYYRLYAGADFLVVDVANVKEK